LLSHVQCLGLVIFRVQLFSVQSYSVFSHFLLSHAQCLGLVIFRVQLFFV
jgi:hypothetical protein